MPRDSLQDHVVAQWVDHTLGRKAAITDVGAALQQVRWCECGDRTFLIDA